MRHLNPISHSMYHSYSARNKPICKPYSSQYISVYERNSFKNANKNRRYVQVLQYVADHPNCSRRDIIVNVLGKRNTSMLNNKLLTNEAFRSLYRGQHSNMFSQLLYLDLIDYDKAYKYHIQPKGLEVLKKAYVNDNIKKFF